MSDDLTRYRELVRRDRAVVWHPYASMIEPTPVFPVASASGARLKLSDGRELIDGMASWWCAIHGYNHPVLNDAARTQLDAMAHVMFGGLTHEPAVRLAETLLALAPPGLDTVFFADSGSVAVEVAMKMAIQYWVAAGRPRKQKFLALKGAYHGDTLGAMSVCDPVTGMHTLFEGVLPAQYFVDRPGIRYGGVWDSGDTTGLEDLLDKHHERIAALILEPVVQGAGGMWFYHPEYLVAARRLCDRYQVLLIADEIATGFGRSGELFALEHAGVRPDILCLGKAMTGGYLTLAATLASRDIADTISAGAGAFMHGPTFMGNPLACAVALANLELLKSWPWRDKVGDMARQMLEGLAPCRHHEYVEDVRVLGAIGVVELKYPVDLANIADEFVHRGVWVRPFGTLVYIMPPYIIEQNDLAHLTQAVCEVISDMDPSSILNW